MAIVTMVGDRRQQPLPLERDARFDAFDLIDDMICVVHDDGTPQYFNNAWVAFAAGLSREFASSGWLEFVSPADRPKAEQLASDLASGDRGDSVDLRLRHPVNVYRWYMLRVRRHRAQLSESGVRVFTLTDIHERKLREIDIAQTAKVREDMLNVSVDCIKVINVDGTVSHMNRAGCLALNVPEESAFGMEWLGLLPAEAHEPGREALAEAAVGMNARFLGVSRLPGQDSCYWDNMLTPLVNAQSEVEAILCVSRDVTAQRESERQIELLLHELNHRSKNMLSVVLALIRRTVPDPQAEFVSVIYQRIASIAKSQDLLIHGSWGGATVRELVGSQTAVVGDVQEKRLLLQGPSELRLLPETTEKIGLALHELSTNAIKYGALSNDTGIVTVRWELEGDGDAAVFCLRWIERGGPEVVKPSRRGFGTIIIENNPRAVRGATVSYSYDPEGITWEFKVLATDVIKYSP